MKKKVNIIEIIRLKSKRPAVVKEIRFIDGTRPYFHVSFEVEDIKVVEKVRDWCNVQNLDFSKITTITF